MQQFHALAAPLNNFTLLQLIFQSLLSGKICKFALSNKIHNLAMLKKYFLVAVSLMLMFQVAHGQRFTAVTPSNHTVYFELVEGGAEAAFCTYGMPNYGSSLEGTLIIPDSVEYDSVRYPVVAIGYNAFHHSYYIDTLVLPNTVTNIKQEAFAGCLGLVSVAIPNSVTEIGWVAFGGCHNLSDLTLGESLVTIGSQAFDADTALVSIVIPNSVVSIGSAAFSQNYSLRTVTFGNSVTSIGYACFTYCPSLDSLIFVTEESPSFGGGFYGSPDTLNFTIPCGSYHSYSYWFGTQHNYTVPTVDFAVNVTSDQPQWGSVMVIKDLDQNDVRCDSSVVVEATANYGYHFQQWSNGSISIQDTIFLDGDTALSATFAKNQYALSVQSTDLSLGTVSGTGVYDYLDTVVITATATAPHYFFERWSDGSTDSIHSVVITGNMALVAYFAIDTHTVAVLPDDIAHGSVTGGGRFVYGTVATVTAAPYSGYRFSHWSDGATYNPYIFAVVGNTTLTAIFIADGEPYQDTIIIHDTVSVTLHDTIVLQTDTIAITVHDTIVNYVVDTTFMHDTTIVTDTMLLTIHDTTLLTDTLLLAVHDTTYLHDTIYLPQYFHDTIYLPQYLYDTVYIHDTVVVGVDMVETIDAKVYMSNGQIVVEGAEGNAVSLYDVTGRLLATKQSDTAPLHFSVTVSGTYLVKIGHYPARRLVLLR